MTPMAYVRNALAGGTWRVTTITTPSSIAKATNTMRSMSSA